jgi:hypothetical protein
MKSIIVPGGITFVGFFGLCFSVLSFAGLTNSQAVQQNTIDFSKAVPNAQGLYFFTVKFSHVLI